MAGLLIFAHAWIVWAEDATVHVGWLALLGVLLPALGVGGKYVFDWWLRNREADTKAADAEALREKQRRADALEEWRVLTHEMQDRIERLQTADEARKVEMLDLRRQMFECERDKANQRVEIATLGGDIRLLQATVRRLQGLAEDDAPATVTPALIVADLAGTMKAVSPYVTPLLHYMSKDLLGKNIEVLVPERLKADYRAAMQRLKDSGQPPWTERTVQTYALSKEGMEVAVTIALSGWQTDTGSWLVSAEIARRRVTVQKGTADG